MNYGRKNAARRKWELTSRGTVMRRKLSSLTLLIVLLLFVSGLGYVGYQGYRFVEKIIADAPDINEIDATPSGYMSTVLDADGNVDKDASRRVEVKFRLKDDEMIDELNQIMTADESTSKDQKDTKDTSND